MFGWIRDLISFLRVTHYDAVQHSHEWEEISFGIRRCGKCGERQWLVCGPWGGNAHWE